jgi:hypothetical protein
MSRYTGRRVARPETAPADLEPAADPGTAVRALAVVAVVAICVVVAGTASRSTDRPPDVTRAASVARDFVCAGGLPGATAVTGLAGRPSDGSGGLTVDGIAPTAGPTRLGDRPAHVTAAAGSAADAYAVRSAAGKAWLAAGACPSPAADWWLVGAGGATAHDSTVEVDNQRAGDALIDVTVLGERGQVEAPGLQDIRVASGSRVTLDLARYAPAVGELAVHVTATRGLVTVSAPERWSMSPATRPVRDWVTPQPAASRRTTLVGMPADAEHATLLVANPSAREAVVTLQFAGERGTFAPTSHGRVSVPPATVLPVDLDSELKAHPLALRLTSQVPVTATVRTVRGRDESYLPAAALLGSASVSGVPADTPAELVLVSASGAATPTVVGYDARGREVGRRQLDVPAKGAARLKVWKTARAVAVTSGNVVTGALVLGSAKVVATIPLTPTAGQARVPAVRPAW